MGQSKISIIIPTHNRREKLESLLGHLSNQTLPAHLIEVVVVADGCKDSTLTMLQNYQAPYTLQYLQESGKGAANARNAGAKAATGNLLLFLDDDIEPSGGLVEAHYKAHEVANRVVVGYLPFPLAKDDDFFRTRLWAYWESKFQAMREFGYRYNYEDLLSGNFSLPADLFYKINGFNNTFKCREDYELGIRLLEAGAQFFFSSEAWGVHRDEVTDLKRSLWRKRQEGQADIQFARIHLELAPSLILTEIAKLEVSHQSYLFSLAFKNASVGNVVSSACYFLLLVAEKFRARALWSKLNIWLHNFCYQRGLADVLKTKKELELFLTNILAASVVTEADQAIDLKEGLTEAEALLDRERPNSIVLFYGNYLVGQIPFSPGSERLRGVHLRTALATKLSIPYLEALALDKLVPNVTLQDH